MILGWLASILLQPFGDPAYRMNLLQALLAAGAVAGATAIVGCSPAADRPGTGLLLLAMPPSPRLGALPVAGRSHEPVFWRLVHARRPAHVPSRPGRRSSSCCCSSGISGATRRPGRIAPAPTAGWWLPRPSTAWPWPTTRWPCCCRPASACSSSPADWRVILRWRTLVACVARPGGTIASSSLELPIRAAMHAPLVYGHPDTLEWLPVRGPGRAVPAAAARSVRRPRRQGRGVMNLMAGWLGPLGLPRRSRPRHEPRPAAALRAPERAGARCHVRLRGLLRQRGHGALLPGAAADGVHVGRPRAADLVGCSAGGRLDRRSTGSGRSAVARRAGRRRRRDRTGRAASPRRRARGGRLARPGWRWALLVGEIVVAVAARRRQCRPSCPSASSPGQRSTRAASARPADRDVESGCTRCWRRRTRAACRPTPSSSSLVERSTTLWYGQQSWPPAGHLHRRRQHAGSTTTWVEVQDVFNKFLGKRPVFTIRSPRGLRRHAGRCSAAVRRSQAVTRAVGDGSTTDQPGRSVEREASERRPRVRSTGTSRSAVRPRSRVPALSFFFPAHNEEANLEALVEEALAALPALAEKFEIIAVDDGSRDRTPAIADDLAARHPDVFRVVHHPDEPRLRRRASVRLPGLPLRPDRLHRRRPPVQGRRRGPADRAIWPRTTPGRGPGLPPQARRPGDPALVRPHLPSLEPDLLRRPRPRHRLRLQALQARGAGADPRLFRRRLLHGRAADQAPVRGSQDGRGRRAPLRRERPAPPPAPSRRSSSARCATSGRCASACGSAGMARHAPWASRSWAEQRMAAGAGVGTAAGVEPELLAGRLVRSPVGPRGAPLPDPRPVS